MQKLTLSERTDILMTDLKVDQVGLARFAGITKGAVNQWKSSKPTATMKPAVAYAIADKSNYEPRWLILGEGSKLKISAADTSEHSTEPLRHHTHSRVLVQRLCDLAEGMHDDGVERLIEHADGLILKYPLAAPSKRRSSR